MHGFYGEGIDTHCMFRARLYVIHLEVGIVIF